MRRATAPVTMSGTAEEEDEGEEEKGGPTASGQSPCYVAPPRACQLGWRQRGACQLGWRQRGRRRRASWLFLPVQILLSRLPAWLAAEMTTTTTDAYASLAGGREEGGIVVLCGGREINLAGR